MYQSIKYLIFFLKKIFFNPLHSNKKNDIVNKPSPVPPSDQFSAEFCSFINSCLQKEEENRLDSVKLLEHEFIKKYENDSLDLAEWIKEKLREMKKIDSNRE